MSKNVKKMPKKLKFFTKTKLTDDPHRLLLRALNFQVDILY